MPGITAVIGPNGSGKSNISDSIRWVLGEQSMKSLRGSKTEDIIFAGTQSRKSLGFAEASIVIDNTDGKLPIEYQEVTVTRRIYRNGESGYFINKNACRLKDVLELFMDTGIGKDGYSIIGQGKIDEILSNKSEDRRHIFEEAAGIVKYRSRKAESEKKLEQTKLNLLRINDILSEIEANIEPLKLQSEKAKKFLDLREELKSIEIGLFLYNIDIYKEKLEDLAKDSNVSQKEAEENKQNVLQGLKQNLKLELDELTASIESAQNLGFESSKQIEQINSDINVAKERITNNNANFERYQLDIEDLKTRISELEDEKKARLEKKTSLSTNKEKFVKELEEKEKNLAEISSKLTTEETEIETKKKKVEEYTDLKYQKREEINTLEINNENFEKRKKAIKDEISNTISELDQKRLLKSEISKTFSEIEKQKNQFQKRLSDINQKREESDKKLKEYDNKINNLTMNLRLKESKLKFLVEMEKEKEGYQKSVKALLLEGEKNTFKGLHGVLANLISVSEEYQTAIEMALGNSLQNLVSETEEDAKKMIDYLRTNNLGRASFLPISSVKGKKVDRLIKNGLNGVIGIASDLVKANKKYEDIIINLLGRTVVVDNMDTAIVLARQNSYSFRIVTLQGDIISPAGSMTGGSITQKSTSIIGRASQIKDLTQEIKKIEQDLDKVSSEKSAYENSISDLLEEVSTLEKTAQEQEIVYATEKQRVISIEESISKLENTLSNLKQEIIDIEKSIADNVSKRISIEESLNKQEVEILQLNEDIKAFAEKNKDTQKYIDDLNFDITNLKISVSSFDESSSSIDEIVGRIDLDIANNNKAIEIKKTQLQQITDDNFTLKTEINNLEDKINEIKLAVSGASDKVEQLKKERTSKNEKLVKTEEEILDQFKIIEDLKSQIAKLDVKKSKLEIELEQIINKMWEDYELTPSNVTGYEKPSNVASTTKRVKTLRDEIKNLGSINVDSIEEYKQTKERYDFMCEQRLDLENSGNKLRKVIQDMTNTMKDQFEKQFKVINKNFGEVFSELFGGGKAEVKLANPEDILECGIDIEVQPPGKKLQNMSLLSGGEKAFTAIALLFAILKINPAPFCVLDEIEAALDDVNVYRFAEYLKNFTKHTQFLVITHRKGTMEVADTVYGITMEESGISKLLSIKLK